MPDPLLIVVGLGAVVGFGIAPRTATGMSADVGIHWSLDAAPIDGFSISLGVRWDPPAADYVPESRPEGLLSSTRLLGTVAPCAHWWKLFGCAVGELGQLKIAAIHGIITGPDRIVYATAGLRLGIEVPLVPHFGLRGFGDVTATPTPLIVNSVHGTLWETPIVAGSVGAGVYFSF
jgi:hypothetical protein